MLYVNKVIVNVGNPKLIKSNWFLNASKKETKVNLLLKPNICRSEGDSKISTNYFGGSNKLVIGTAWKGSKYGVFLVRILP